MGRMLARVLGLAVVLAILLLTPAVAAADPTGSIAGWRTPASGDMTITIWATPDDVALVTATASLGPKTFDEVNFRNRGGCQGLCPVEAEVEIITSHVPVGDQDLVVRITDANGKSYELERVTLAVERPPTFRCPVDQTEFKCSVEIRVGSEDSGPPSSPPGGGGGGSDPGPTCRAPHLSARLTDRPLRYRRGVPVLKRGKVYRFAGKLSCRIDGRRRPAPRGIQIQQRHRLRGGWTVAKPSLEVRKAGEFVARLAFRSSRTVVFRVRGAGGELMRVRIPVRVVRR